MVMLQYHMYQIKKSKVKYRVISYMIQLISNISFYLHFLLEMKFDQSKLKSPKINISSSKTIKTYIRMITLTVTPPKIVLLSGKFLGIPKSSISTFYATC